MRLVTVFNKDGNIMHQHRYPSHVVTWAIEPFLENPEHAIIIENKED